MRDVVDRRMAEFEASSTGTLDLSGLGLRRLPVVLRTLAPRVDNLLLSRNKLSNLPEWIGEFESLSHLDLSDNLLKTVPRPIAALGGLDSLFLGRNDGVAVPEWVAMLTSLRVLSLDSVGLRDVPLAIRGLNNLHELLVARNQLAELPEWIGELTRLQLLAAFSNRLTALPRSLTQLENLNKLIVDDNKLDIPEEILGDANAKTILEYYFRTATADDRRPLNEFKLILVGRGGVGKTSLVHRLTSGDYKEFKRTPGIKITQWPIEIDGDEVRAHVWDFGGQEIMHGTHRFFMTERALYLVLISGREGSEDRDAEYWLSMVRSFAGDVPVIVLLHKVGDYRFQLNTELLRGKFGREIEFFETDSVNGEGIEDLKKAICRLTGTLPGLKSAWPSEWWRVKEELP